MAGDNKVFCRNFKHNTCFFNRQKALGVNRADFLVFSGKTVKLKTVKESEIIEQIELESLLERLYEETPFNIDESMESRVGRAFALAHPDVTVVEVTYDKLSRKYGVIYQLQGKTNPTSRE